jgi:hypothetical protein
MPKIKPKRPAKMPTTVTKKTPTVAKKPAAFSGDSTYAAQLAALNKALADYRVGNAAQVSAYNQDYGNQVRDLNKAKTDALDSQMNDYAGRGVVTSGVYLKDRADTGTTYANQQAALSQGKVNYLGGLSRDMANYLADINLQKNQAAREAALRKAAGLGIY